MKPLAGGPDPRSGVDEEGRWTPAFEGQRPPFEPKHGAYADVRLGPRVVELVEQIVELVPVYPPADEVAVRLLCLALARLEAAEDALAKAAPGDLDRLAADARGWLNSARRLLNDLGMTPTSRAWLGLDLTRTKGAALRAHVAESYGDVESA